MSRMTHWLLWNTKGEICPKAKTLMRFEQKGDDFLWITSWISIWASFFFFGNPTVFVLHCMEKCTMKLYPLFLFSTEEINQNRNQNELYCQVCLHIRGICFHLFSSHRFGLTWGWVNDDRIFIFGWTIPLSTVMSHVGFLKALCVIAKNSSYTNDLWGCALYNPVFRNGSPVYFGNWVEVQVWLADQHKLTYFLKQQCNS